MIYNRQATNKKNIILLLGYGVSNKSVYKFLKKRHKKLLIYVDKNPLYLNQLKDVPFPLINKIITSAGIKPSHSLLEEAKRRNIPVFTDLDILYKYKRKKDIFVGVTGTNGKTTTCGLVSHILNLPHLLCGNIGTSIFKKLRPYNTHRIYIIEISSFQAHHMQNIKFHMGVITNLASNHDEWHGSFNAYVQAKQKLLNVCEINNRDSYINHWSINNENNIFYNNTPVNSISNRFLKFSHNKENLILALWIVENIYKKLEVPLNKLDLKKLNSFKQEKHRQDIIYETEELSIINDSKSTSIHSTNAAINNFKHFKKINKPLWVLMGGDIKGNLLDLLINEVDSFIVFGASRHLLGNFLTISGKKFISYETLKEAIQHLPEIGVVVFSPGGASFDEFKDYKDRGDFFNNNFSNKI
jgi:UDP-N-acetylmuramoylalanine--D-glutamate ligase